MTPEEIQRQAAARNSAGQLGEARQRALPAPTPRAPGTSIATVPQPQPQARPSATPPGGALATTAQPAPGPITGTAKPVPGPQPTRFVDSQGNAATRSQLIDQANAQRMAADRAARLNAVRQGGVSALNDVMRQQRIGTVPGATPAAAAPAAAPSAAPAAAPAAAAPAAAATGAPAATQAASAAVKPGIGSRIVGGISRGIAGTVRGAPGLSILAGLAQTGARQAFADTDRYAERFGADMRQRPPGAEMRDAISEKLGIGEQGRMTIENLAEAGRDVLLRSGGALTDFGAAVGDGLSSLYNMMPVSSLTGDIPSIRSNFADERPGSRTQTKRVEQRNQQSATPNETPASPPPDIDSLPVPESKREQATASPDGDRVLGTFNGREIRASEAQRLADTNVVPAAAMQALARTPAAQQDNGQGQLLAMLNQARGDRMSVQSGANERLQGLYEKFNDQIKQGRRRTAAVIGEQIRAELGVLGQTANGQMIDPRQPGQVRDEAEAGRIGEVTAGQRLENQARERLSALEAIITNPEATEEQRAQAATQYQLLTGRGGQQQEDARIVQLPGPDGFTTVPALLQRGSTQAIPITAAQQPADAIRAQAQAAIQAGADPEKVNARLKELGIQ